MTQSISQLISRWEANTEIYFEVARKDYIHEKEFAPYC